MDDPQAPAGPEGRGVRGPLIGVVLATGIVIAVVLLWFQPQRLFIDDRVNDAAPAEGDAPTTSSSAAGSAASAPRAESNELASGSFVSLDHATTGTARILEVGETSRIVRLEGFETENGPDLFVYLTTNKADADQGAFDDEFVNLGRLKGNIGDQNYEVPADVDLARYATVVIWCDRFNSPFGAADLSPA